FFFVTIHINYPRPSDVPACVELAGALIKLSLLLEEFSQSKMKTRRDRPQVDCTPNQFNSDIEVAQTCLCHGPPKEVLSSLIPRIPSHHPSNIEQASKRQEEP